MIGVLAMWSLLIVGFFWGGCPCCGDEELETHECGPCQSLWSTPALFKNWRLEVAGVTDGTESECAAYNGTWDFSVAGPPGCGDCITDLTNEASPRSIRILWIGSGGSFGVGIQFGRECSSSGVAASYLSADADPPVVGDAENNCLLDEIPFGTDNSNSTCDDWPSTMTMNAI